MDRNTICIVTNRSRGPVSYRVPEMHVVRLFQPNETKRNIPYEELEAVSMQPGGTKLLHDYLFVQDAKVVNELLNMSVEQEQPEYLISEEELIKWIPACSLDEFKDALDYAPEGIKDLIKKYAVELPINDVLKRTAIKDQLGFDVNEAIRIKEEDLQGEESNASAHERRVKINNSTPKYKVVNTTK